MAQTLYFVAPTPMTEPFSSEWITPGQAGRPLRVLVIDDSPDDATLVTRELRAALPGAQFEWVESEVALRAALQRADWDLVVSDYALPCWSGIEALKMVQATGRDIPFILMSGTIGEETAVQAMKAGAHDYFLKGKLTRLGAAVTRELREASERRERRRAQAALRFLADASLKLALTLDTSTTLKCVTSLIVPALAEWCFIHRGADGLGATPVAAAHADGSKQALLESMSLHWTPGDATAAALATREPQIVWRRPLMAMGDDDRWPSPIQVRGYLIVPLVARGRSTGVITFGWSSRQSPPDAADVSLAQDLACRASLAMENARLYGEATESVRVRDEFISIASHELRTPLTPLQLQLQSVLRLTRNRVVDPERITTALEMSQRQVQRMTKLTEQLLSVSRIMSGRLVLIRESVDLAELTRDVAAEFEDELIDAGCALSLNAPMAVIGRWDKARLNQVLAGLLSNAMKFGVGKPVDVIVERKGDRAYLRVTDHGLGISPADQARIFERFERAVSTRHYGGFGLGLWMVRQILEAHGGSVRVHSAPDDGATFVAELPVAAAVEQPMAAAGQSPEERVAQ